MAISEINSMYDNEYQRRLNALKKKREQDLLGFDSQRDTVSNEYQNLTNQVNKVRQDVQNRYKGLYGGLDNQYEQGKQKFYGDRNAVDVGVNQNLQRLKELMAAKGWTQGGANLQAQLNTSTDRMNGLGQVATNETNYNQNLNDQRNKFTAEEQSSYVNLDNQVGEAERKKAERLTEIKRQIDLINSQGLSDEEALKAEIEASRMRDINSYNEQLRREALEAQRIAEQRAYEDRIRQEQRAYEERVRQEQLKAAKNKSSSSGGSKKSSKKKTKNNNNNDLVTWAKHELNAQMKAGKADEWIQNNKQALYNDIGVDNTTALIKRKNNVKPMTYDY